MTKAASSSAATPAGASPSTRVADASKSHAGKEDPTLAYLRSLTSVRERCTRVLDHPAALQRFDVHPDRLPAVAAVIRDLIARDYTSGIASIPPHSRWRHLDAGHTGPVPRVETVCDMWKADGVSEEEVVRRCLDLFTVSVLLDAGAGSSWRYTPLIPDTAYATVASLKHALRADDGGVAAESAAAESAAYGRSEGLAVASLDLFLRGGFSSDARHHPHRVDAVGLRTLTLPSLDAALQVSPTNAVSTGLQGRLDLLHRLADVTDTHTRFFPAQAGGPSRPGDMLTYLLQQQQQGSEDGRRQVPVTALWRIVVEGLAEVWPASRTRYRGQPVGDVWPCAALRAIERVSEPTDPAGWVTFHKLSQWLTYSLMEPLALARIYLTGVEAMTGLAEYRYGGA